MSKYTLGPWTVTPPFNYGNENYCIESKNSEHGRVVIAELKYDKGQQEANAHILCAAPHLAESLKEIMHLFNIGEFVRDTSRDGEGDWSLRAMREVMTLKKAVMALEAAGFPMDVEQESA